MLFLWHRIDSVAASKSMPPIAYGLSDIAYIRLQQGWVYLAVFIDLFSRQVVGWALSKSLDHGLVLKARRARSTQQKTTTGFDDPFGSRHPICLHRLSAVPQAVWLDTKHESES